MRAHVVPRAALRIQAKLTIREIHELVVRQRRSNRTVNGIIAGLRCRNLRATKRRVARLPITRCSWSN